MIINYSVFLVLLVTIATGTNSQYQRKNNEHGHETHGETNHGTDSNNTKQKGAVTTSTIKQKQEEDALPSKHKLVKKTNFDESYLFQPGFAGGIDYISNFNLNPINVEKLQITDQEKQFSSEISLNQPEYQDQQSFRNFYNEQSALPEGVFRKSPFAIINYKNPVTEYKYASAVIRKPNQMIHPDIVNFQKRTGNTPMFGYQMNIPEKFVPQQTFINEHRLNPDSQIIPQIQGNQFGIPKSIQDVKQQQEESERRFQSSLSTIHDHPEIKSRLDNFQRYQDILQQTEHQNYNPNYNYHGSYQNIPESINNQGNQNAESYPENNHGNEQSYEYEQQNESNQNNGQNKLSSQRDFPVILVDPQGNLGLPFYPTSEDIKTQKENDFNYEGIPLVELNSTNNNQQSTQYQQNQNADKRVDTTNQNSEPIFAPSLGYTRETIWQAGDPTADPENETLVRQLNETCAYIQFNETTPGTEDGSKLNIYNAGDYSAQREEDILARSINITCDNYTADAMSQFSSGFTVVDYCSQCVKNNSDENSNVYNEQNQGVYDYDSPTIYTDNNEENYYQPEPMKLIIYTNGNDYGYDNSPNDGYIELYKRNAEKIN